MIARVVNPIREEGVNTLRARVAIISYVRDLFGQALVSLILGLILVKGVEKAIPNLLGLDERQTLCARARELSGIKSWFLGSISKYVVENCKKPILIVK